MSTRFRTLALATGICLILAACGSSGYSQDLKDGFMNGCEPSVGAAFCECALTEIEQAFAEEEFIEMDLSFPTSTGESPPALTAAIEPCQDLLEG